MSQTETEGAAPGARREERVEPHLFLMFSGSNPTLGGSRHVLANVDEVVFARGDRRAARRVVEGKTRRLFIEVPDARMSSKHARLIKRDGFHLEDAGSRNGTRVNGLAVKSVELSDGDIFDLGRTVFTFRAALTTSLLARADLDAGDQTSLHPGINTLLPGLLAGFDSLGRVAEKATSPILILGETGSGKEVLARAIHQLSRRSGRFIPVNCGALPSSLVEGLLFGFNKGAFTGALKDELGFVRAADHGTLFLDEIGDLPLGSQAALLRVLQEREVTPVGATSGMPVDVRVVAATHAPVEDLVEEGLFRSDLYSRLAGFVFRLPPLRERKEDLGTIIAQLLERLPTKNVTFTAEAARAIAMYNWPRNVRELEHCLSISAVLAQNGEIDVAQLPETVTKPAVANTAELSDEEIQRVLSEEMHKHKGNISQVARSMGKARTQIQRWIKRFGLKSDDYKG